MLGHIGGSSFQRKPTHRGCDRRQLLPGLALKVQCRSLKLRGTGEPQWLLQRHSNRRGIYPQGFQRKPGAPCNSVVLPIDLPCTQCHAVNGQLPPSICLRLGRGLGGRLGSDTGRRCQTLPIDLPILRAPSQHPRLLDIDGSNVPPLGQGLQVSNLHCNRPHVQQRLLVAIAQAQPLSPHMPPYMHGRIGLLLKRKRQIHAEHARLQAHGQTLRQVAQVGREIEIHQANMRLRLAAGKKRRGLSRGIERTVIELEGQAWLHLDFALGRQAAQEWHAQRQIAHCMGTPHGAIFEVHRATTHGNVVKSEARRRPSRRGIRLARRGQAGQDVVDVVMSGRQLRQAQHRLIDLQRIQHRRQAQQRCHADIGKHTGDGELRPLPIRSGHSHVMHRELQRPGYKLDAPNAHVPPQCLACQLLSLAAQQGRQRQPPQGPQHQNGEHEPDGTPQPRLAF